MKKFILCLLALLFTIGVAYADGVPMAVDPKNYRTVWTADVYNGSGATIISGHIVEWDFDASDSTVNYYDDMSAWVQTCDSASDVWTAGVAIFGRDIADGETGQIIIRGPAYVRQGAAATVPVANQLVGSDASGYVITDAGSADTSTLGICIKAADSVTASGTPDGFAIIYVDPTQESD